MVISLKYFRDNDDYGSRKPIQLSWDFYPLQYLVFSRSQSATGNQ